MYALHSPFSVLPLPTVLMNRTCERRMVRRHKKLSFTFPLSFRHPKLKRLESSTSYETSRTSQSELCPLEFQINYNPSKASILVWSKSKNIWNPSSKVLCRSTIKSFTTFKMFSTCYRIWRVRLLGVVKGKRERRDHLRLLRTISCWLCIWVLWFVQLSLCMISYVHSSPFLP